MVIHNFSMAQPQRNFFWKPFFCLLGSYQRENMFRAMLSSNPRPRPRTLNSVSAAPHLLLRLFNPPLSTRPQILDPGSRTQELVLNTPYQTRPQTPYHEPGASVEHFSQTHHCPRLRISDPGSLTLDEKLIIERDGKKLTTIRFKGHRPGEQTQCPGNGYPKSMS